MNKPKNPHIRYAGKFSPARITILFFVISALWIFFSDNIVHSLFKDIDVLRDISIYKGMFFILITSVLIFYLIRKGYGEQKVLFSRIQAANESFDIFANATHELIWTIAPDGTITYVNKASKKIFGYEPEEMIGLKIQSFVDEAGARKNKEMYSFHGAGNHTINDYENYVLHKDGSRRILLDNAVDLKDANGNSLGAIGTSLDITDRKLMEEKLKVSEEKYRNLVDTSQGLIWAIDNKGEFTFVSKASKEQMGYEPDELIGKNFTVVVPPEQRKKLAETGDHIMKSGELNRNFEMDLMTKDGRVLKGMLCSVALRDENGKIIGRTGTTIDITDRKKAEEELKSSEEKYRTLTEVSKSLIWSIDTEGNIVFINNASKEMFGYETDELIGKKFAVMLQPDTIDEGIRIHEEKKGSGSPINNYETSFIAKNGERRYVILNSVALKDSEGRVSGRTGTTIDITDIKKAEEKLRLSEEMYRSIVETFHEAVYTIDNKGAITFMNSTGKKIFGYEPAELIGRNFMEFLTPGSMKRAKNILDQDLLIGSGVNNLQLDILNKNNECRTVLVSSSHLINGGNLLIFGTILDITDRLKSEKLLAASEEKYKKLVETSHGIIWSTDKSGNFSFINSAVKNILGFEPRELLGRPLSDLVCEEQKEVVRKKQRVLLNMGGTLSNYEVSFINKNGNPVNVLINSAALTDAEGNKLGRTGTVIDITERKRSEEMLKESEVKYRSLVETVHGIIWSIDNNGNILFINNAVKQMLGYEPAEMIGTKFTDYIAPEQVEIDLQSHNKRLVSGAEVENYESKMVTRDGKIINILSNSVALRDVYGNSIGRTGTVIDITERIKAEEKIRESEERYKSLVEASQGLIWMIDTDGKFLFVSQNAEDYYGIKAKDLIGHYAYEFQTPEQQLLTKQSLENVIKEGKVGKSFNEDEIIRSDGRTVYLIEKSVEVRDSTGNITGIIGTSLDITRMKEAQEQINLSEQKYRNIVETTHGVVWSIDEHGTIMFINEGAYDIIGYKPEELIGKHFGFTEKNQNVSFYRLRTKAKMNNNKAQFENIFWNKLTGKPLNFVNNVVFKYDQDGQFKGITGNSIDVTGIKENEEKLRSSEEKYRNLIDASQGLIWTIDTEGKFVYLSRNASDFYGISAEELVGRNYTEFKEQDEVATEKNSLKNILEKEKDKYSSEGMILRPDGTKLSIVSNGVILRDAQGNPTGIMGTSLDVTARKKIEEEKRLFDEQFRILYEASQQLSLTLDIREICRTIFESLKNIVSADSLVLSSYDEDNKLITIRGYWIDDKELDVSNIPPIPLGKGVQSTAILSRQAVVVNDYQESIKNNRNVYYVEESGQLTDNAPKESDTIKSAIVLPLKLKGKVTGVMQLFSLEKNKYNEVQLRLVESLSNYISAAQQNALLYNEVNKELEERKQTEEALRKSEKKYHVIFESTGTATLIVEGDTTISLANNECVKLTGYKTEELIGRKWTDFVAPESLEEMLINHALRRSDPAKAPVKYEVKLINKFGEIRNALLDIGIITETRQSIVSIIDVTELKQAGDALRISEEKYRNIVETANEGIWMLDKNNITTFVNRKMAEMLGLDTKDIMGKPMFEFMEESEILLPGSEMDSSSRGFSARHEFRFRRKNGEFKRTFVSSNPLYDKDNRYIGSIAMVTDIDEWKKVELALKESEKKYRNIVETANEGIIILNDKAEFIYANDKVAEVLGYDDAKFTGMSLFDLIYEDQLEDVGKRLLNRGLGETEKFERRFRRKDGTPYWMFVSASPMKNERGEYTGSLAMLTDINEWKLDQLALKESETKYRTLTETSPFAIRMLDLYGNIYYANSQAAKIHGYQSSDELTGMNILELVSSEDRMEYQRTIIQGAIEGKTIKDFVVNQLRKDGTKFPAEVNASSLCDSRGKPIGIISIVQDITERKRMENQLKESEAYYRALVETSPFGIGVVDLKGRILFGNKQAAQLQGYEEVSEIEHGLSIFDFIAEEEREMAAEYFEENLAIGTIYQKEVNFVRKDGIKYPAEITASMMYDSSGNPMSIMTIIQDITERKSAEIRIKESEAYYRTLLETLPVGIVVLNEKAQIAYTSAQTDRMFGLPKGFDPKGTEFTFWMSEEYHDIAADRLQKVNAGEIQISAYEYELVRYDKTVFWVDVISSPYYDSNGRFKGTMVVLEDITQRKKIESQIKESEEYHRRLIETLPLGIVSMKLTGELNYISPQVREMFNLPVEFKPEGMQYANWLVDEEKQLAAERITEVVTSGDFSKAMYDYRLKKFDGEIFWANTNTAPIMDSNGNIKELLVIVEDISERKRIEQQVEESEAKYRTLIETIPEGIVLIDSQGVIGYHSPQILEMFRIPKDFDPSGTNYMNWILKEYREAALARFTNAINSGEFNGSIYDYELMRFDNTVFWGSTNTSPFYDSDGSLKGILVSIQDISDVKKAQQELQESRERLSSILSTAMDAIITIDEERKIILFNAAAETLLKCPASEAIGSDINRFIPERYHAKHDNSLEDYKESGKTERKFGDLDKGGFTAVRSDGKEVPVEISISKANMGGKYYLTSILRDTSEREKYESELRSTNLKLHSLAGHLQKVREEERLLISRDIHDQLGQDLTALKMDISMLAKDIERKKEIADREYVVSELKSMADLTDSTIKWIRKFSTELRPDVLDRLGLFEANEWHAKEFEDRTRIKCKVELKGDDSALDKDQAIVFFRILQESLTNVLRHSQATKVGISMKEEDDYVQMIISDNGKGIPPDKLEENSSLGLINMKERAYALGGEVEISGITNKGTKVIAKIPKLVGV